MKHDSKYLDRDGIERLEVDIDIDDDDDIAGN